MAATLLSNMIIPDIWRQYVIERTAELSAFWASGVVTDMTEALSPQMGGTTINMPFFQDLTGDDEVIDDTSDLTVNNITTAQDVAAVCMRAKSFGSSDLAGDLAGSDPLGAIGERFAAYWARRMQAVLINTVTGAMGAANMTANVHDITGLTAPADQFDGEAFVDATAKLGDAHTQLTAIAVHSATEAAMRKQDLIDYIKDSDGETMVPTYQGKRVIVDDGMPVDTGDYTSYLFGVGAIGYSEGEPKVPAETQRESLQGGGTEWLTNRRRFVLHPRGIRWTGTPSGPTPTNAELATPGNWTRVYEPKNIRIVQFKHALP